MPLIRSYTAHKPCPKLVQTFSHAMLVLVFLLNQTVLALLGMLYRHYVIDVLLRPDDADLRSLITDDFLCDHTPLANVSLLATALSRMRASHPDYVDLLFGGQFLARHIFPLWDEKNWLLSSFQFHVPATFLVLTHQEYYLNVLAGALYGTWIGLAICSVLSAIACAITFLLVRLIHYATDQSIMVNSIDGRKRSAWLEAGAIEAQIIQLEYKLTQVESTREKTQIREKIAQLLVQARRANLRWLMARLEELQKGDLINEQLNLDYDSAIDGQSWSLFKDGFLFRLTCASNIYNIWNATTQMPVCINLLACALGYLPYAFLGTWTGGRLLTMETEGELYEDQVPRWRFNWLIFALTVYLTKEHLDWRVKMVRQMRREKLQVQRDIAFTRWTLGEEVQLPMEEEEEELEFAGEDEVE